jgi:type II secretory pathway pseudopilin PulG
MEIIVATTIFAVVITATLSLFDYALKINRKSEAIKQAAQGMRNFVETFVKDVRNGEIEYGTTDNGVSPRGFDVGPCISAALATINNGADYYAVKENKISLINPEGSHECVYYADSSGSYVNGAYNDPNGILMVQKENGVSQRLNPVNTKVESFALYIRPAKDPFNNNGAGYVKIQPGVTIMMKFTAELPTKEKVSIYYQTSVSTNKYDIPNQ